VKSSIRSQTFLTSRTRRLLRCGTALPLLLAAWPALAEPIVEQSSTDISVDAESASGTPVAVDLVTDGGAISATVDTVTATAAIGTRDHVIGLQTADGAINAVFGTVTATGEGTVLGIRAGSTGGDIDVHVGQMTIDGAITSGVQARSVSGDVTVRGDNVLVTGTGGDPDNDVFPEGLLASSDEGAATVIGGTVETRGLFGSAAVAIAGTDASVTIHNAIAHSAGAVTVYAFGKDSATIDAGSVSMLGNGAGAQAISDAGSVTIVADSVDSNGGAIFGRGATGVSITAGTVDAVDYGLSGRSNNGGSVDLTVTDSVTVSGNFTIGVLARTTGDVSIDAANVAVTGPGAAPGVRPDGYRFDQGGIVVLGEGGSGAISIDAGAVNVAGEHRYGITARGNGAIAISADAVTLASADSVAVVARGGEGDVSITTGTVTTTGASGVGVFGNSTTGNIVIDAGTTRVENAGMAGQFTGDAVVATSTSGNISIASADAFSAALHGSALVAISGGNVAIDSGVATTTGEGGAAVYGSSSSGSLSISADQIVMSGANTGAINAFAPNGAIDIDVGTIVGTGANSRGIFARVGSGGATIDVGSITTTGNAITLQANTVPVGQATINIAGAVASDVTAINIATGSANFTPNSLWTTVNVAEGASVSGTTGIGLSATFNNGQTVPPQLRSGFVLVNNDGTIAGTSGTALALGQTNVNVTNAGTIGGDVVAGGGMIQNRGGTIDGSVTLNTQVGNPLSMFAYEGASTGVTGTITGGQAIDTFAQIFTADGTAVIGGGLPTAFDRYGVVTDSADTTVIVETAANPVGATPALMLLGDGSIVNRADLSGAVIPASGGAPLQIVPAVTSYGFAPVQTPFGIRFTFEGAGVGPASFTNEASITGRIVLTTSEFVNSGSIQRSSAGVPSVVTARIGEAFSFTNTGTISMIDQGARVPAPTNGNPFNDFNPYQLPEPAMTIRSAVSGSLDAEGIYVPATIANSGTITGGLLARMTASTFTFDNSGTISGFNGSASTAPGLTIGLGRNWDSGVGDQNWFEPAPTLPSELATFTNSGQIADGARMHFIADTVTFANSGRISGNSADPAALAFEQSLELDGLDAASFSFVNTGQFDGNVGLELEALSVSIENGGSIVGREYAVNNMTFPDLMFGGEAAFEIDNETNASGTLSFVNTGSIVNTGHAGSAVTIEVEAGDDEPDLGGGPVIGNANVSVVNSGTISATGGATLVTQQFAPWLEPGQFLINPIAALAVDATDVSGSSVVSIENQAGGLIKAGGGLNVLNPNGYFAIPTAPADTATVAIYATGKTITIINAGAIEGGAGTVVSPNAVHDGDVSRNGYIAGAIQTAGDEYGEDEVYIASIDHVTNTATGTIVGSIDLGGNDDRLDNAGTITGDVYLRDGNDVLANAGTLTGNAFLGAGDDVLELSTSSIVDGFVDLGDGTDEVLLAGAGANVGQVADTVNAERLTVASGAWRADGTRSAYTAVGIAAGATLTVGENADGEMAIETPLVELAGRLNLEFVADTDPGDLAGFVIEGAGSLHLTGAGTVLVDDASALQHTGGTFVDNGELLLTTLYGGDITTTGGGVFELAAGGDFTGNLLNNGIFRFTQDGNYSFSGDFSGSGLLEKYGAGTLAFDGLYAFDGTTSIFGGLVTFTGKLAEDTELDLADGTLDLSNIEGGEQTIAQLSGTGGTLQLGETQLVIQQMGDTVFSGGILGLGTLVKEGEGDLKLDGDGTGFTGTGQVDGGTLSVNGDFSNANFVVNEGGTLGGAGTIGDTNVNGGTLAPGNSIDTLNVNGDIAFTAASVFEVEVDAAGNSDRLNATGTATLGGATVNVIAASGTYRPLTDYTILAAAGGVSGTFGSVQDNLAFLDPSLIYSANAVTLRLVRNDIDFSAFGATANQSAIGGLIESFGYGNALYNETLLLVDGDVAPSFASLTGEVYPAYGGALIETAEMLRRQTTAAGPVGEGVHVWATALYSELDSGSGAGTIELNGQGAAGGLGFDAGGFSVMVGLGMLDQQRGGSQFTDGDVTFAIGRLAYTGMPGLSVSAGAQFGWVDASTRRQTTLGAINQAVTGQIDGEYLQLFGEIGYRLPVGGGLGIEPFARVSHVSLDLDGVTETGAPTALVVAAVDRDVTFADFGLRLSGDAGPGLRPFASAAYRVAWGDRASVAAFGFAGTAGTAGTALVGAVPIARSAAELSAGVVVTRGAIDFEVGYDGTISKGFDGHGVSAGMKVRF